MSSQLTTTRASRIAPGKEPCRICSLESAALCLLEHFSPSPTTWHTMTAKEMQGGREFFRGGGRVAGLSRPARLSHLGLPGSAQQDCGRATRAIPSCMQGRPAGWGPKKETGIRTRIYTVHDTRRNARKGGMVCPFTIRVRYRTSPAYQFCFLDLGPRLRAASEREPLKLGRPGGFTMITTSFSCRGRQQALQQFLRLGQLTNLHQGWNLTDSQRIPRIQTRMRQPARPLRPPPGPLPHLLGLHAGGSTPGCSQCRSYLGADSNS